MKFINKHLLLSTYYVLYTLHTNKWASRPEPHDLQHLPALKCSQRPALRSSDDAELSVCGIICSCTIGGRKCSPQHQTLKPNESNVMSLTCHWIKLRRNAVGSTLLPPLKSCLQFLLFCCYRHFNRLLNIVFPLKVFVLFLFFLNSLMKYLL